MNLRVLAADDPAWDDALARVGGGDVFFTAAYHRACEADGRGAAALVEVAEDAHVLLQPLLVRPVERVGAERVEPRWSDAESAYGYTGPLASADAPSEFLAGAWAAYDRELDRRGVVAEFVRLHPYLANERVLSSDYSVFPVRTSVTVPLEGVDDDALWRSYPSVQRNMVRRARAAGLACRELPLGGAALDAFLRLYEAAMNRLGAGVEYFFSRAYFETLAEGLGERARLLAAEADGTFVGMAVFLAGGELLHYHLAASDPESRLPGHGNLLLDCAARLARDAGLRALHLGGGRTADPADSLLRFKLSVSRETLPVHAAARVHDRGAYEALCARWLEQAGVERPPFHLLYRLPLPA